MWWSNAGAQLRSPLALFRGTSQGIGNGFGKGLHSPLLPLALPHAAQQSGQKQPGGIQRLATIGLSPEIGHRPAQVIPQDVQEAHGMPSRDMWGEFPAFCGGEDREEFSSEPGREKRKPPANPPSAPGGALVRSRPPHPRRQLALEGKEKQVTLCICRFPAPLPLPGGSEVADGKCRLRPELGCSSVLWWLWTRVPWVSVHVCLEAHRAAGPSLQKLILFRLVPAGCSLLAPAMPELIPSDASALCQMLLQDAGPTSVHRLRTPPGWPCHKRRHGNAVTAWAVLAAAHDDAGTSSLLPAPGGSAGSSLFPLSSFLCSPCYVTCFPLVAVA